MQTIIDENIAEMLAKQGYFYIMHRFEEVHVKTFIEKMHAQGLIASISVGVKDNERQFVRELQNSNNFQIILRLTSRMVTLILLLRWFNLSSV